MWILMNTNNFVLPANDSKYFIMLLKIDSTAEICDQCVGYQQIEVLENLAAE